MNGYDGRMTIGKCGACGTLCNLRLYEDTPMCYYCRFVRRHPEELKYLPRPIKERVKGGL